MCSSGIPLAGVGRLYAAQLAAAARFAGLDAGLSELTADTFIVDPSKFSALIHELLRTYRESDHQVLRHQLQAVLAPSLVMLNRSGIAYEMVADDRLGSDVAHLDRAMPV